MSQHLNLLPEQRSGINPALVALAVLSIVTFVMFAGWGVNQLRLSGARASEVAAATELRDAQALIQQRTDTRTALEADLEALKPLAEAADQLLKLTAALGKEQGYGSYFSTIAGASEEGLWITDVEIKATGSGIRISGQSLSRDAVVRFSHNLNSAFAAQGIKFTALELNEQPAIAAAGSKPLPASTRFVIY